jgi:hypothetical protein
VSEVACDSFKESKPYSLTKLRIRFSLILDKLLNKSDISPLIIIAFSALPIDASAVNKIGSTLNK